MTDAGLVVTDLSHLGVGLDIRGDFRGPVRFAVSSKPSSPARRCERVSTWCAGSASAVSVSVDVNQSGALEDVWQLRSRWHRLDLWFVLKGVANHF